MPLPFLSPVMRSTAHTFGHHAMVEFDTRQQSVEFYLRRPCTANGEKPVKLHLADPGNTKQFTAHGADYVMVNGERFDHSIVVSAEEVRSDWTVAGFDALSEANFNYFLALRPDVLLLGTGSKQHFAHPRLVRALTEAGIGVECMNTPAACRTFNILVAENRKVIAAILF